MFVQFTVRKTVNDCKQLMATAKGAVADPVEKASKQRS